MSSSDIRSLEPKSLWNHFADLNEVPRPSKKEERVIQFIKSFGEGLGLPTSVDKIGNVIIRKSATAGMENRETVVLQSHLDMVHQKNADTNFDFNTEGIKMLVDGDWVKAEGTTLGADNGIGVATIMALLTSTDIPHPAIEALFTIDEETGMTGALNLQPGALTGRIMLNLDTEDDTELTIGCAGGVDVSGEGSYNAESISGDHKGFKLTVKGLTGGHSGMDIHIGRGNANKLMNRLLYNAITSHGASINSVDGGGLRNAIPRESFAIIAVPASSADGLKRFIDEQRAVLKAEYSTTDPNIQVEIEAVDTPANAMPAGAQKKLVQALYACPNGIYRMSPDIAGLVQSSNNLARVLVQDGKFTIQCLTRSSVDSEKMDLADAIRSAMELAGASVTYAGSYPGWAPKPESGIVKLMSDLYRKKYNSEPHVYACHAGLECGILGGPYEDMEMISFGPNIRGAHSPDEKVQISSVQKYWDYLLDTLKQIPEKK
jgi:dipeptidase D